MGRGLQHYRRAARNLVHIHGWRLGYRALLWALFQCLYYLATLGFRKGPHVTRYTMYRKLQVHRQDRAAGERVLSISGSQPICRMIGFRDEQITDAQYPETNMLDLPFGDDTFDAVVSDQVLEHVAGNPYDALAECFRVLKPGGLALHTTCFINPVHGAPDDFWRFTPAALKLMAEPYGAVVDAGAWGNPWVWPYCGIGLRMKPVPHSPLHPLHWLATINHPLWPIVTWVAARKH